MQIDGGKTQKKNTPKDDQRRCVCTCLHVCGYTHGCMHMCVGMNVSRYERSAQQRGSLVEKQVNDRQRLDKDNGMNKEKGTAGKVGVKLSCRWCWMDTSGT